MADQIRKILSVCHICNLAMLHKQPRQSFWLLIKHGFLETHILLLCTTWCEEWDEMEQDFMLPEYLSLQEIPFENWTQWIQRFKFYLTERKWRRVWQFIHFTSIWFLLQHYNIKFYCSRFSDFRDCNSTPPLQTLLYNRQFIIHIILTCIMQTYSHNTNTQLCPSAVCFNELHSFCNRAVKPLWKRSLRWLFIAMQRLSMP